MTDERPRPGLIAIPFPNARTRASLTHYTGQFGLHGIIRDAELWATHIRFLNDSAEYQLAMDLGEKVVKERLASTTDPRFRQALKDIQMFVDSFKSVAETYVFSMSADGDDLGQWRAYSDDQRGYGIVFDGRVLRKAVLDEQFALVKCEYREKEQRRLIVRALDSVLAFAPHYLGGEEDKPERLTNGISFSLILSAMSPALKHNAFVAEREWRLISIPGAEKKHPLSVRTGKNGLVPFLRVRLGKWAKRAVRGITVGPMPDQEREILAVKKLLAVHGLERVPVKPSGVPFRTW